MEVLNVHERKLVACPIQSGELIDSLATVQVSPGPTSEMTTLSIEAYFMSRLGAMEIGVCWVR